MGKKGELSWIVDYMDNFMILSRKSTGYLWGSVLGQLGIRNWELGMNCRTERRAYGQLRIIKLGIGNELQNERQTG